MRRLIVAMAALLCSGCAPMLAAAMAPSYRPLHSTAEYPYERTASDAVWARALAEFQRRGVLIATCNERAAFIASQSQPLSVMCGPGTCSANEVHQFTMAGGVAVMRTNRSVLVNGAWAGDLSEENIAALHRENAEFLAAIVGDAQLPSVTTAK